MSECAHPILPKNRNQDYVLSPETPKGMDVIAGSCLCEEDGSVEEKGEAKRLRNRWRRGVKFGANCNTTRSRGASQVTSPSLALFTGTFNAPPSCLPYSHTRYCGVVRIKLSVISSVSQIRNCCLTFAIHVMDAAIHLAHFFDARHFCSNHTTGTLMLLHRMNTNRKNPLATFYNKGPRCTPFFVI